MLISVDFVLVDVVFFSIVFTESYCSKAGSPSLFVLTWNADLHPPSTMLFVTAQAREQVCASQSASHTNTLTPLTSKMHYTVNTLGSVILLVWY